MMLHRNGTALLWKIGHELGSKLAGAGNCLVVGFRRNYSRNAPNNGYTEVDKLDLYWERVGKGPHVVLGLPGLVGSYKETFLPVFEKMDESKFTLIGWDPPGYGKSRPPTRDFLNQGVEVCRTDADLATKLMEKLGYKRYSILGTCEGGRTGAIMAAKHPERITKLVLYGAPKFVDATRVKAAEDLKDLNNWSPAQRRKLKKIYEVSYLEKMLADFEKYMKEELKTQRDSKLYEDDLAKIKAPTLIIYGNQDTVVGPTHAQEYQKAISNSRLHEIKGGLHDHLEILDELVSVTSKFLLAREATKSTGTMGYGWGQ